MQDNNTLEGSIQDTGKGKTEKRNKKKKLLTWRSWHKWVGMVFSIFIMVFCFSGIVLNHRQLFSGCEVSRWWLPEAYHVSNWNQSIVKGTQKIHIYNKERLMAYGQAGLWLTDSLFHDWQDFNNGITEGIDNRKISGAVQTADGTLMCAGLYDAYVFSANDSCWQKLSLPGNEERISDIAVRGGDTVVIITRSSIYEAAAPHYSFIERPVHTPKNYDSKTTLFKTVWTLHSGELFGIPGKLVVDAMAVVIIILCLTGIIFFILSYSIKYTNKRKKQAAADDVESFKAKVKRQAGWMKWNLKWHNRFGSGLIILTLLLSVTGMCLRPPLMVPLVMTHHSPIPGTTQSNDNVFHDKLRAIRWDDSLKVWLLSTSEGFFRLDGNLQKAVPVKIEVAPGVSPMGVNVFCRNPKASFEWLVGSFSGLFSWNPATGQITDWFTGAPPVASHGMPLGTHTVTGFTSDLACTKGVPAVFEYSSDPNVKMPEMPEILKQQPMSLWNFALELHVGRCYEPFLGSIVSVLFVFISGLLLTLVLVSGYIIYRRSHKKR